MKPKNCILKLKNKRELKSSFLALDDEVIFGINRFVFIAEFKVDFAVSPQATDWLPRQDGFAFGYERCCDSGDHRVIAFWMFDDHQIIILFKWA